MSGKRVIVPLPHGTIPPPDPWEEIRDKATVTSSQRIYRGDMVALTREIATCGERMRVAIDGAKLLSVDSSSMVSEPNSDRPAVLIWAYTQDGNIYLKTARYSGGQWALGATVLVCSGDPDRASVVYCRDTLTGSAQGSRHEYVTLLYEDEGSGAGVRYRLDGLSLTQPIYFRWATMPPQNFTACWAPAKRWGSDGSERADDYPYISVAYQSLDGAIAICAINAETGTVHLTAVLEPGTHTTEPAWRGKAWEYCVEEPMHDEYSSSAWHLQCQRTHGACYLTYPGADGKRYVLEYLMREDPETSPATVDAWVYGCRVMICSGYVSCGSGLSNLDGRETYTQDPAPIVSPVDFDLATMPWLVGVIARTAGGASQKSALGLERFLGGKQHFLTPLGWIETSDKPRSNMGLLSCCRCGTYKSNMAVAYESEGTYRAFIVHCLGDRPDSSVVDYTIGNPVLQEPICGPDVELAAVGTEAALVECDRAPALIYQRGGSIYLQKLEVKQVAAPAKASKYAAAVAVTGGSPGQTIKIAMLRAAQTEKSDEGEGGV